VVFTGFLKDEDGVALLNLAKVLLLPSLMERFGLPAVEAAACGCPVIATKASLLGLLGGGGIYVEPVEGEIARALEFALSSEETRLQMGEEALRAAQRLTWDHAARQFLAVIHGATRSKGHIHRDREGSCLIPYGAIFGGLGLRPFARSSSYTASTSGAPK
jgi:glycosyltransferase involved in cell wall biosynthesis